MIKNFVLKFVVASAFAGVLFGSAFEAQAQFQQSSKWVPDSANSIVMIRAEKILESKIGVENKWKTDRSKAFRSGAAFFPPTTERILMAAQIDYEYMEPIWKVAVFESSKGALSIANVSKRVPGNIESISGRDAIALPNDAYLVKIDDKTLVSMSPGNRQLTSRWLRTKSAGASKLSKYLARAVEYADSNSDMIVAFDLEGAVSKEKIQEKLEAIPSIDKAKASVYAGVLAGIEGVTLGVTVRDKITGAIKIDIPKDSSVLLTSAKPILIQALKNNGLMIDDIEKWTVKSGENQIVISGPLSELGFREIGSLIRQPLVDDFVSSGNSDGSGDTGEANTSTRTKQYFSDIVHIMDLLKTKSKSGGRLEGYAKWFDRHATDIDRLPILGVDEDALDYGQYVANSFRDISASLRGSKVETGKSVAAQGQSGWTYNERGSGRYSAYSTNWDRRNQNIARGLGEMEGGNAAREIMNEVDKETATMRRKLTQKYQIEF